mgnify:FL=1
MKIKFYGTRGSIPVCHRDFLEFGGNTTSLRITRDNGRIAILDAGTGIRQLGRDLVENGFHQNEVFIGFTHFHWDHIQGFPFFSPAYDHGMVINILAMGKDRGINDLEEIFKGQMQPEYFPVPLKSMGAKFNFLQLDQNEITINRATVRVIKQNHPGGSFGYRMEDNGKVFVFCTDLEHGDAALPEIIEFCKGADLLVHEAQYTAEELKVHKGWGHSSYEQALEVAEKAGVKKLAITHHDPEHNDTFLTKLEKECQKRFANCVFARENMELTV